MPAESSLKIQKSYRVFTAKYRKDSLFIQAKDGIRDLVRSRELGDVYKRQELETSLRGFAHVNLVFRESRSRNGLKDGNPMSRDCLLYTSDAADDLLCVDLGGRRHIKKKNKLPSPHSL